MQSLNVRGMFLLLVSYSMMIEISRAEEVQTQLTDGDQFARPIEKAEYEFPTTDKKPPRVSANLTDDAIGSTPEGTGFKWPTLPKPKMPALPKPSLPKLALPTWTTAREMPREKMRPIEEPSSWDKLSSGTKDLFSKTKQTLMPWSKQETTTSTVRKPTSPRRTPTKSAARTKAKAASAEKKSFFPSWGSKKEEEKPFSVNEFLSQPRIP